MLLEDYSKWSTEVLLLLFCLFFLLFYFPTFHTSFMAGTVKTFSQPEQWHITKLQIEQESRNIAQQLWRRKKPKINSPHIQMRRWPRPPPFVIFKAIESAPFQSPSHLNALFSDTNRELLSRRSPRQLSINNPSRWTEIDNVLNPSITQATEEDGREKWMEKRERVGMDKGVRGMPGHYLSKPALWP